MDQERTRALEAIAHTVDEEHRRPGELRLGFPVCFELTLGTSGCR